MPADADFNVIAQCKSDMMQHVVELCLCGRLCEFHGESAFTAAVSDVSPVHEFLDVDIAATRRFKFAALEVLANFVVVNVTLAAFVGPVYQASVFEHPCGKAWVFCQAVIFD